MTHQALYRRYRPSSFGKLVGQSHVVAALRNAVTADRVAHAYLFSGPRGTGKTSTARILAKALNCLDVREGEPCGECQSCAAFTDGTSYDMHELDAASHNSVDDIRELNSRVVIGSPGRTKVYVLDEVHMLSSNAENALLKTLEEPPEHVVFILCTTEPHKVARTIKSRTQHLQFKLLPEKKLHEHVLAVADDAGIELSEGDLAYVMAEGGGSARDTLSALDQVAAAGAAPEVSDSVNEVLEALASGDAADVSAAADRALKSGQEPRVLGEALLKCLRNAFLTAVCGPGHVSRTESSAAAELAQKMKPKKLTRAMELLGEALVGMRTAPDPRVDLELALVRLSRADLDLSVDALAARIEKLEEALAEMRSGVGESKVLTSVSKRSPGSSQRPPVSSQKPASTSQRPSVSSQRPPATSQAAPVSSRRSPAPSSREGGLPEGLQHARRLREQLVGQGQGGSASAGAPRSQPSARSAPASPSAPSARSSSSARSALESQSSPASLARSALESQSSPASLARSALEPQSASASSARSAPALPSAPSARRTSARAVAAEQPNIRSSPDLESSASPDSVRSNESVAAAESGDGPPPAPPTREEAVLAWSSTILPTFPKSAVASLSHGRFSPNRDNSLRLVFDHQGTLQRSMAFRQEVEAAFSRSFNQKVSVEFEVDDGSNSEPPGPSLPDLPSGYEITSVDELSLPRQTKPNRGLEQMKKAFPGSKIIDQSS